ncbi:hypothetical protein PYV02_06750 [Leifsonia sp. H3M29-4]|uniref:hypothetical protein n=1 Tax=Salinibacterium metalliresistens TaxID=3031321 RepID=UPI0023D983AD|nr:hypothetical protein [Salinibacterium metalliresistens]MDF1478782.1 hypothetical protein [Salinibacterium metalliresistens]
MFYTVGYDVSYAFGAVVMTPADPVEVDPARMDEIVTHAEYLIARRGDGKWNLINRYDGVKYDERTSLAELTIVIPTGPDERRELFDAIRMIEEAITDEGDAVYTDLRTVESSGMRCCACDEPSRWLRRTRSNSDRYFCDDHAKREADFGRQNPGYFVWKELRPVEP